MREKTKAHRETEAPQELERQLSRGQAAIAYLQENQGKSPFSEACTYLGDGVEMAIKDFSLYHIQELTFEEKAPRREAMENILGTFRGMKGIHFLYLILGDENKVKFYFGVARDYSYDAPPDFSALDVGRDILLPGIRGNFRGSAIAEVSENEEKAKILETLRTFSEGGCLFGVPGSDADSESFQGVDRLIDVMAGDRFGFLLLARPYAEAQVDEIETALMEASDALTPLAHYSVQRSHSKNVAVHEGRSITHARQGGRSTQKSDTQSASSTENQSYDRRQDVSNQTQSSTSRTGVENFGQDRNYHSSNADTSNQNSYHSDTKTEGWGNSTNESHSVQEQIMDAASYSASSSETTGQAASTSQGDSHTLQRSVSQTVSKNRNREESEATNDSDTRTEQVEVAAKRAAEWLKYIDEVLLPRLDHGRGKGLFLACAYLFSEEPTVLGRLANTAISLYSGPKGNRAALAFHPFPKEEAGGRTAMQNMQIPAVWGKTSKALLWAAALSLDMGGERRFGGSWLSAEELGIFAALPQKEVPGLALREEVDFGLNMNLNAEPIPEEERIPLGRLVQNGIPRGLTVDLDKRVLNKHIFITGVTGSGKTTTCQHILRSWSSGAHPRPFLLIEPAKTEYRMMRDADVLFFTLGQQDVAPFFLNPFELFPGEKITARADMLKAAFTAAFEMEAAIPQILETSIYRAYEAKGWDIRTNRWQRKGEEETDGPFADGMNAFPTMADFLQALAFLGAAVGVLSGPLGGILGPMVYQTMISKVIQGLHDVAKKEEIVEEEERVEDIGYRLAEADRHPEWRQQEEFSSWKEYYAYVKQQIPDAASERGKIEDNALGYQLLGMTGEWQAIEQKAGMTMPEEFLNEVGRSKMEPGEILAFTDVMKIFHWALVQSYLEEKLPPREMDRIEEALLDAMERRCDGCTRPELETRLLTIREAHFDDQKLSDIYREELQTNYPEALKEAEDAKALPDFYAKKEGTV